MKKKIFIAAVSAILVVVVVVTFSLVVKADYTLWNLNFARKL